MKIWTDNFDTVLKHVKDGTAKDMSLPNRQAYTVSVLCV